MYCTAINGIGVVGSVQGVVHGVDVVPEPIRLRRSGVVFLGIDPAQGAATGGETGVAFVPDLAAEE